MTAPTPDASASDDVQRAAERAARGEVRRLFWKVVYFLLGVSLVAHSMATPQAVASAGSPLATAAVGAVGVLFFVGGAYLLAYVFDIDRVAVRWLRRHA
ncbi:hypothetical protein [Halarchaeum nitratireducens]|uniref:DUF485 domain-containing protein n=1 Tax=Halarchaeum nitratireducens TaxID=489913 RepID=A0A830GA14_9EURY|nr:hypothetical protein [Halarchaeum nitratireducens]GGN12884.1 hypothetical protein GCM10009021_11320 [Halarchaeum nitratireducens]